jgi:hypothetical protein
MKKLLMGSAALTLFSISIIIFQMSCKKDATAQTGGTSYTLPPATTSSLGGIIVGSGLSVTSNGTLSINQGSSTQQNKIVYTKLNTSTPQRYDIWTANYDGTNQTKLNVTMPVGYQCAADGHVKLSPNGQKIFFTSTQAVGGGSGPTHIFSCNIDGTSLTKIIDGATAGTDGIYLGGVN